MIPIDTLIHVDDGVPMTYQWSFNSPPKKILYAALKVHRVRPEHVKQYLLYINKEGPIVKRLAQ